MSDPAPTAKTEPATPEELPTPRLPQRELETADVRQAISLLQDIIEDRGLLAALSDDDRIDLLSAAGRVAIPERHATTRLAKAVRRRRQEAKRDHDRAARASTGIRSLRREAVFTAPTLRLPEGTQTSGPARELKKPRACYVCKTEYRQLHFFYDSMCNTCADFNYAKRFQTAPLHGKVALITGARVKIGFQASLMLLRAGARVIATTRFPIDATLRYSRENDFAEWSHRLHVHGLDLRHAPSVEILANYLAEHHDRLDILINNAAQTVRRPAGFYAHLMPIETQRFDTLNAVQHRLLDGHLRCLESAGAHRDAAVHALPATSGLAASWSSADPAMGLHSSAALSQLPYVLERDDLTAAFPEGRVDADLQQIDLRAVNTWRLTLSEVDTAEMLEVHLVNAVAPFILCSKLKPLMLRHRDEPGHIVNVSAMEGSFSRGTKTDKHPHTNMAKAALNMMTLTSAQDYAKSGIFMNAVDTGWVTDEDPMHHAQRKIEELDFQPPLDIVDGAARIIDPVFAAQLTGQPTYGNFFKDYFPTDW